MNTKTVRDSQSAIHGAPLRIGINLLYLIPGEVGGVETYARCVLDALAEIDDVNEYCVFLTKCAKDFKLPDSPRFRAVIAPINARNRYARYLWEQVVLPLQILAYRLSLVHSLNYVGPLCAPCKAVVTIHDMNYSTRSKDMKLTRRLGASTFSHFAAKISDSIVTVSEFSKSEICRILGVAPAKIRMIHSGFGWRTEELTASTKAQVLNSYRLDKPYLVVFGGGYPHKNIPRLLRSYQVACRDLPYDLVIIGRLSPDVRIESAVDPSIVNRVRLLGTVPTEHIHPLLSGAAMLVFPSLYEGFGFPVLEAQRARTPVICSQAASLPEIAGNAADFFDPESEVDMARVMRRTLLDQARRERLVDLGLANVRRFLWAKAAHEYLDLYRTLCGRPMPDSERNLVAAVE